MRANYAGVVGVGCLCGRVNLQWTVPYFSRTDTARKAITGTNLLFPVVE